MQPASIRVTVHLHAGLARIAPQANPRGVVVLDVPTGTIVADVLGRFEFPAGRRIIVGLNGAATEQDTILNDGDRLDLVTPMSGG